MSLKKVLLKKLKKTFELFGKKIHKSFKKQRTPISRKICAKKKICAEKLKKCTKTEKYMKKWKKNMRKTGKNIG